MAIEIKCAACGSQFRAANRNRGKAAKCNKCGAELIIEGTQVAEYDAFVSYSENDKPTAEVVVATLEAAGLRCWMAPRDIAPGSDWGASIIEAISSSHAMVLVFSGHSNESKQVVREVERAINKGVTVIPLRIDETPLSANMEYFISTSHWLDALAGPLEQHLQRLVQTITAIAAQDDVLAAVNTETAAPPTPVEPVLAAATETVAPPAATSIAAPVTLRSVAAGNGELFAGTFKSDQLMVEFKSEAAGQITGLITLGEKQFPASGVVQGGRLTGSFESDGAKFDFTATVDEKTMTLETGGTRYVMQKPVNPLERSEPAPVNPLAAPAAK